MDGFKSYNLNINVVTSGERVVIDWNRPEDAPALSSPDETIKTISFSDRVTKDKAPDMELTVYFDHAINTNPDPDEEPEAWKGEEQRQQTGPRCSGKERLVTEAIMCDIIKDKDNQIMYDRDACQILKFHRINAQTVAQLLLLLADRFQVNSADMAMMARAAELPTLRI